LLLIAIASTDFGQALPIVLVALSLITIVFFGPLLLPSLLCIRITDDALEIVSPFWIQRVAWTDIERFTSVDFDLHTGQFSSSSADRLRAQSKGVPCPSAAWLAILP
jgi:hypothetical protein